MGYGVFVLGYGVFVFDTSGDKVPAPLTGNLLNEHTPSGAFLSCPQRNVRACQVVRAKPISDYAGTG